MDSIKMLSFCNVSLHYEFHHINVDLHMYISLFALNLLLCCHRYIYLGLILSNCQLLMFSGSNHRKSIIPRHTPACGQYSIAQLTDNQNLQITFRPTDVKSTGCTNVSSCCCKFQNGRGNQLNELELYLAKKQDHCSKTDFTSRVGF